MMKQFNIHIIDKKGKQTVAKIKVNIDIMLNVHPVSMELNGKKYTGFQTKKENDILKITVHE